MNLFGVVIKIALNKDDRSSFVAAAGSQVGQRTDQVGQLTGSGALRSHVAFQVSIFIGDVLFDSSVELLALQTCKVVVGQVFQFYFVGGAAQTGGVSGRYNGVSQLRFCLRGL